MYPSTAGFLARAGCGSKQDQGDPGLPTQRSFFCGDVEKKELKIIWLGVIGLALRAVLSQVPEITFIEFFLYRYHLLMTLGVGNIDQKLLK